MLWLVKHQKKILWFGIFLYATVLSLICVFKYSLFQYNLIDLAIFNQVFFNSSQGSFFALSIHPPTYLGDHLNPVIFILLGPYYLLNLFFSGLNQPLALLIMQSFWLALGAWPVFLIAKNVFLANPEFKEKLKTILPLGFALAYLFNPLVQNINLYEFHLLPLAVPLLLFAFYFYQKRKFWPFLIFIVLSLLVREDVSLVIFMFGVLAFLDRKRIGAAYKKWVVWPMVLSIAYFLTAMQIVSHFNTLENYKYTVYYSWIMESGFLSFIKHFVSVFNIEMFLGFLLPFAFLPLLKPKYLLLALPILAQILLGAPGGSGFILKTHYSTLFVPALIIASIYGLYELLANPQKFTKGKNIFSMLLNSIIKEKAILVIILITAIFYSCLTLGPGLGSAKTILNRQAFEQQSRAANYLLEQIPPGSGVGSSYSLLSPLSSRPQLTSLHYVFMGKQEFGFYDFKLPPETQYLLIDLNDFVEYYLQMHDSARYREYYKAGDNNMREALKNFGLKEVVGNLALFEKGLTSEKYLYSVEKQNSQIPDNKQGVVLLSKNFKKTSSPSTGDFWQLDLNFYTDETTPEDYQILVKILDSDEQTLGEYILPPAWGLYPTSEWQANDSIKFSYWLNLPPELNATEPEAKISLIKIKGGLELNGWRGGKKVIDEVETIKEF